MAKLIIGPAGRNLVFSQSGDLSLSPSLSLSLALAKFLPDAERLGA